MTHLVCLLILFAGFIALAMQTKRHRQAFGTKAYPAMRLRSLKMAGFGLLAIALGIDCAVLGSALGPIAWTGQATLAGWGAAGITFHAERMRESR